MKLLDLNINKYLLLEKFPFINPNNNIDSLNARAVLSNNLTEQLSLLNLATHKIEKFHSFFHFEQSYFHTQLAIKYLQTNQIEQAKAELELAIFQDHVNQQAIELLNNSVSDKNYERPFVSFAEYLQFATDEQASCEANTISHVIPDEDEVFDRGSCEDKLLRSPACAAIGSLPGMTGDEAWYNSYWIMKDEQQIIETIRYHHLHYHQESAKLYLNRATIFHALEQHDLAKNDLIKAKNLDSKLKEREYYPIIISQLGVEVVLGLGSNLGDRQFFLEQAIKKLKELDILNDIVCSSVDETKAYLEPDSLAEWDLNYLNMAVKGFTMLNIEQLLKALKDIEHSLGREGAQRCAPRTIDLDILAYGDQVIQQDNLQVPHVGLLERSWVLKPFAEIYPQWKYPKQGPYYQLTIREIYEQF